jgi:branched-subunit amino acid ABC-type transport system permease component
MGVKPDPDVIALVFAIAAATAVVAGVLSLILETDDPGGVSPRDVFDTAQLMVAGVLGYLSGRFTTGRPPE